MEDKIKVELNREYRIREVSDKGFILNSKGNKDYSRVLALTKQGILKSRIYETGSDYRIKRLISGHDIKSFIEQKEPLRLGLFEFV